MPVESLKVSADVAEDGLDDGLGGGVTQSGLKPNQLNQVAGVATDLLVGGIGHRGTSLLTATSEK